MRVAGSAQRIPLRRRYGQCPLPALRRSATPAWSGREAFGSTDPPVCLDVVATGPANSLGPVQRAELVAVRVAYVCQVHGAQIAFTQARRVFDRHPAVRDSHVVELLHLLR